jgi:hypothetical protein
MVECCEIHVEGKPHEIRPFSLEYIDKERINQQPQQKLITQ